MKIPARVRQLKRRIDAQVEAFFELHRPEDVCLVLDSTGPSLTKHYLVLHAIGRERLARLREIHSFSGGVWAYFGFLALAGGKSNHSYEAYATRRVEGAMRRFHHPTAFGPLRALYRLACRKPAFGSAQPIHDMLNYYFAADFMAQRLEQFPHSVRLHIGMDGRPEPLEVSAAALAHGAPELRRFAQLSIREIIVLATTVPFVYGRDRDDIYYDAAYAAGYVKALKRVSSSGRPTLVSTPWKTGRKDSITFVNCFASANPQFSMALDFARLILNIPNNAFGHDIVCAFATERARQAEIAHDGLH